MGSTALLSTLSRRPFAGRNDYYGNTFLNRGPEPGSLLEALAGIAPFDVTPNGLFSGAFRDAAIARLNRYRLGWMFYKGEQWGEPYDSEGEKKPVINFCKKVVDTAVDWFVADGWSNGSPSGNEEIAELCNAVWDYNSRLKITERLLQFGAVTGDSFLYVTLQTKDGQGNELPPDKLKVRLMPLDPAHCFPIWNPINSEEMLACLVQFPMTVEGQADPSVFSLLITPNKWISWLDQDKQAEGPNPFGMVNVVHFSNLMLADSLFGQSDIHQIIPLNEEYNSLMYSVRRVIKYHGEPTTVVFGAKLGDMERGSKKIWSNLPVEARVENLELQTDLVAINAHLDRLERLICVMSNTPRVVMDSTDARLSNTSGLAMQMTFQPLIEKTRKRQTPFAQALVDTNVLVLVGHQILGYDLTELVDDPETMMVTKPLFSSPLPRDEQAELDAATKKRAIGVWSRAEAIRKLSGVDDHRRLVLELAADDRFDLAMAYETQRANSGQLPNFSAAFLSSSALSEDLEEVAAKSQQTEQSSITRNAPATVPPASKPASNAPQK
jgi:hypothetical protein